MGSGMQAGVPPGRSPVTQAGRVAYNAFLNAAAIRKAKKNSRPLYRRFGGRNGRAIPTDDASLSINRFEICIGSKSSSFRQTPGYGETDTFVLSSVNGQFDASKSVFEVQEGLEFKGLASGDVAYDSRTGTSEIDIALQRGGLATMVNTGPERIEPNTWVMWQMPDTKNPQPVAPRGCPEDKVRFWTVPYNPARHSFTIANMRDATNQLLAAERKNGGAPIDRTSIEFAESGRLQAAEALRDALITVMALGAQFAVAQGLAAPAAGVAARSVADRMLAGFARNTAAQQAALDLLFSPSLNRVEAQGIDDAELSPANLAQANVLTNLFAGIDAGLNTARRRVFARSVTAAEPGGEFDVHLSVYMG